MQIEQYEQALTTIAKSLRTCPNTKLLYTTTIPLASNITSDAPGSSGFVNEDIWAYNAVAKKVMAAYSIPVMDFFAITNEHCGANFTSCDWHESHDTPMWKGLAEKMAPVIASL